MRINRSGALIVWLLTGCIATRPTSISDKTNTDDLDRYGVRIIRAGMKRSEAEGILGHPSSTFHVGAVISSQPDFYYTSGFSVKFDRPTSILTFSPSEDPAQILSCEFLPRTTSGYRETLTDEQLQTRLEVGMSPTQVESRIGVPKYGYSNEPNVVALIYPQPGIEVVFVDDKLRSWVRKYRYESRPIGER